MTDDFRGNDMLITKWDHGFVIVTQVGLAIADTAAEVEAAIQHYFNPEGHPGCAPFGELPSCPLCRRMEAERKRLI